MLKLIDGKKLILRVKSGKTYVVILSQSSSPQDINYKGELIVPFSGETRQKPS